MRNEEAPTLLVVGDVPETLAMMRRSFRRDGYRVMTAADAEGAVRAARSSPPDLILVELGAPPLLAADIGRSVRAGAGLGRSVPVVVYADRADATLAEGCEVALGLDTYVTLPARREQLVAFLGRLSAPAAVSRSGRPASAPSRCGV
jgi:two-component system, cell cycle response regulator